MTKENKQIVQRAITFGPAASPIHSQTAKNERQRVYVLFNFGFRYQRS